MKHHLSRLLSWRNYSGAITSPPEIGDERPLRAELYNVDQLERHARTVAAGHLLATGRTADQLLPRLAANEQVLIEAYVLIANAAERNCQIAPAAEWLLDNFYLIEEQIQMARRHLPRLALARFVHRYPVRAAHPPRYARLAVLSADNWQLPHRKPLQPIWMQPLNPH